MAKSKEKQFEPSWAEYHAMVRLRKLGWRITRGKPGHARVMEKDGLRSYESRFARVLRWAEDFDNLLYTSQQEGEE